MRSPELIVCDFVIYLAVATALASLSPSRRRRVLISAAAVIGGVALLGGAPTSLSVIRDWLPGLYALIGYWLAGLFGATPAVTAEQRLAELDARVLSTRLGRALLGAPRIVLELLELAYLSCYGVVAAAFLVTWTTGTQTDVDRFWAAVLLAVCGCYGTLPWLSLRPPRALPGARPRTVDRLLVRRVNLALLRHGSVGWNTFPSAHVAGALAAALASAQFSTAVSIVLSLAALGIAAGAVIGRYHYTIDALLGLCLGLCAWSIV